MYQILQGPGNVTTERLSELEDGKENSETLPPEYDVAIATSTHTGSFGYQYMT